MRLVKAAGLLQLLAVSYPSSNLASSQNLKGIDGAPNDDVITPAAQMHVASGRPGEEPDPSYQDRARAESQAA